MHARLDVAAHYRSENRDLREQLQTLSRDLEQNRTARLHLELQLRDIEAESRRLAVQWIDIEQKNLALANLYVAVRQLHGTLSRAEVLDAVTEIIVGLIGSETLAVFERSDDGAAFRRIASMGIPAEAYKELSVDADPLGRLLASGERYLAGEHDELAPEIDIPVCAVLPLRLNGRVSGGIVLFRLLSQKCGFQSIDYELFDLLATHAAIALHCTAGGGVVA